MQYILFCAYGKQKYSCEALYSILSYFNLPSVEFKNISVVVFTDNSIYFNEIFSANENVIIENISDNTISDWLNGSNYMPRLKIKSLQYFFQKYQTNVLFVDSDTFFLEDISQLFEKISRKEFIMYSKCTPIDEVLEAYKEYVNYLPPLLLAEYNLYKDIRRNNYVTDGKNIFKVSPGFQPFNSGVIGMHYSFAYLLDDVLILSDIIQNKYNYFSAEEVAFSQVFGEILNISVSDSSIYHYSDAKICRAILAKYFNYSHPKDIDDLNRLIKQFSLDSIGHFNIQIKDMPYFNYFIQFYTPRMRSVNNSQQLQTIHSTDERKSANLRPRIDFGKLRPYHSKDSFHFNIRNNYDIFRKYFITWEKLMRNQI